MTVWQKLDARKADPDVAELLTKLGASSIVARSNFESDPKPLAKETYVGAVDTVGGNVLSNILTMVSDKIVCDICDIFFVD